MSNLAAKTNADGEVLLYPLELPLYEGTSRSLSQTAAINLTSALRHLAVVDAFVDNDLINEYTGDMVQQEFDMATTQLISTMCCIASIADMYNIDIMQEIMQVPWTA